MSEINEINEMNEINELTATFTNYLDYIDDNYEYIIRPFENALRTGKQIDTFTEEKLKYIKEGNLEYMICALCARRGFLNVLQWLRAQDPPCPWDEKICKVAAGKGNINVLQWLRAQDPPCPCNETSLKKYKKLIKEQN